MKVKTKYQESFDKLYSKGDILKKSIITLLIILFLDYLNIFTKLFEIKGLIPIYLITSLFLIIKIIEFKPWNLYKLETVNYVDSFLVSMIICLSMYILLNINLIIQYKTIISFILILFFYVLEIVRVKNINKIKKIEPKNNIYDLKDLYDGKINNYKELIFIKESDVDYDLLDRGTTINNLNNVINNCYTNEKFVIALEGSWGSGKTTILNNLKKELNHQEFIIIDDFDPWSYEDEKSLFRGMFDAFMKEIGINFSIKNINKFLNTYMDTIFYNSKYEKHYSILKKYYTNFDETNKVREIINNYLKSTNKRILFIIDNIERAEKDNIIFLFKLINNILNFENTIYLLSFDDQIMQKIFNENLNIDYNYLKKIIQLEIKIPEVDKYVMSNIVSRCINNLFKLYKIPQIEKEDITEISNSISDLREFKRYLNSVITFQYKVNNYLNCADVFLLEIIKKENYKLYNAISKNKKFFISYDAQLDRNIYTLNTREFNIEGKAFFDTILNQQDEKYKNILKRLFPNVKRYLEGKTLRDENNGYTVPINKEEYDNSILNKRISNARYFDLYFCQNKNEFTQINEAVDSFIKIINNNDDMILIKKKYIEMLSLYKNWIQKYILEILEINLKKVNINKRYILLTLIYRNLELCDDSILFFQLNALSRSYVIMSELVTNITQKELNHFKELLEDTNSNLYIIHELVYWTENNKEPLENKEKVLNILKEISKDKINKIFREKINILDNKNYVEKNIWGFYHATKDNEESRKKYIKSILNEKTIFRFLNDMLSRSLGNKYGYRIIDENINAFTSREEINNILNKVSNKLTDDENILLKIYHKEGLEEDTLYLDYDKKFKV